MTELLTILKFLAAVLPFALLSLLCVKANLKKEFRSRHLPNGGDRIADGHGFER